MKRQHSIFTLILSILVTIVIISVLVFVLKVIQNKNEHASAVLMTLSEKMKEKEDAVSFGEKVIEVKALQDSINSHFIDLNKIDTFVGYLEDIGPNFGSKVTVDDIDVSQKTKNIVNFDLSISGTFKEVLQTVDSLENLPYRVNITQVYLNKIYESPTDGENTKSKITTTPKWQADVSFNIVSL
jgi:hypothetical protein